jgi:hypothetical protein
MRHHALPALPLELVDLCLLRMEVLQWWSLKGDGLGEPARSLCNPRLVEKQWSSRRQKATRDLVA